VEDYPAASMRTSTGYKGSKGKAAALAVAVESLKLKAAWLNLGEYEDLCRQSDDAFDAVIGLSPFVPPPWILRASRTRLNWAPRGSKAGSPFPTSDHSAQCPADARAVRRKPPDRVLKARRAAPARPVRRADADAQQPVS